MFYLKACPSVRETHTRKGTCLEHLASVCRMCGCQKPSGFTLDSSKLTA